MLGQCIVCAVVIMKYDSHLCTQSAVEDIEVVLCMVLCMVLIIKLLLTQRDTAVVVVLDVAETTDWH